MSTVIDTVTGRYADLRDLAAEAVAPVAGRVSGWASRSARAARDTYAKASGWVVGAAKATWSWFGTTARPRARAAGSRLVTEAVMLRGKVAARFATPAEVTAKPARAFGAIGALLLLSSKAVYTFVTSVALLTAWVIVTSLTGLGVWTSSTLRSFSARTVAPRVTNDRVRAVLARIGAANLKAHAWALGFLNGVVVEAMLTYVDRRVVTAVTWTARGMLVVALASALFGTGFLAAIPVVGAYLVQLVSSVVLTLGVLLVVSVVASTVLTVFRAWSVRPHQSLEAARRTARLALAGMNGEVSVSEVLDSIGVPAKWIGTKPAADVTTDSTDEPVVAPMPEIVIRKVTRVGERHSASGTVDGVEAMWHIKPKQGGRKRFIECNVDIDPQHWDAVTELVDEAIARFEAGRLGQRSA